MLDSVNLYNIIPAFYYIKKPGEHIVHRVQENYYLIN